MDNSRLSRSSAGYTIAAIVAILFSTALTIAKESYTALLAAMKSISHHWTVHGVIVLAVFLILGALLSRRSWNIGGMMLASTVFISTAISGFALLFFFLTL